MNLTAALWSTCGMLAVAAFILVSVGGFLSIDSGRASRPVFLSAGAICLVAFGFAFAGIWSAVQS